MFKLTAEERSKINPTADGTIAVALKLMEALIYEKQIDFIKGEIRVMKQSRKHYTNNTEMLAAVNGQIGAYQQILTLLTRSAQ